MVTLMKQYKAISLISGGLDSMLATKLILDQGIHVEGINFFTGFCVEGHTHAIRKHDKPKRNNALWVAEQLSIKLHIIDIVEEYKNIVLNPQYGYGAHLNPCLDCKIFMVKKAKEWIKENNFDFIITGEVIGQRPKSQRKETMPLVATASQAHDLLLRPLCAKLLPPTLPERQAWVDREKLGNISGRGRKSQINMAEQFGIKEYAQPAGGCCFLTDEKYTAKLQDLWDTQGKRHYELDDILLLKVGRHLRPKPNFKMIIGREEGENNYLEGYKKQFTYLRVLEYVGPLVLIEGELSAEDMYLAARITARFSDGKTASFVKVQVGRKESDPLELEVKPFSADDIKQEWYI